MRKYDPAKTLAVALLAGEWSRPALEKSAIAALGARSKRRARRIVDEILASHKAPLFRIAQNFGT